MSWVEESEGGDSQVFPPRPQLAAMELVTALCRAGRSISSELVSVPSSLLLVEPVFPTPGFKVQPPLCYQLLYHPSSF